MSLKIYLIGCILVVIVNIAELIKSYFFDTTFVERNNFRKLGFYFNILDGYFIHEEPHRIKEFLIYLITLIVNTALSRIYLIFCMIIMIFFHKKKNQLPAEIEGEMIKLKNDFKTTDIEDLGEEYFLKLLGNKLDNENKEDKSRKDIFFSVKDWIIIRSKENFFGELKIAIQQNQLLIIQTPTIPMSTIYKIYNYEIIGDKICIKCYDYYIEPLPLNFGGKDHCVGHTTKYIEENRVNDGLLMNKINAYENNTVINPEKETLKYYNNISKLHTLNNKCIKYFIILNKFGKIKADEYLLSELKILNKARMEINLLCEQYGVKKISYDGHEENFDNEFDKEYILRMNLYLEVNNGITMFDKMRINIDIENDKNLDKFLMQYIKILDSVKSTAINNDIKNLNSLLKNGTL